MPPAKILLTGFKPFDGFDTNPTQVIVEGFSLPTDAKLRLQTAVLDVNFGKAAAEYPKLLEQARPDFILNTGLSASGSVLRLEKFALNTGFDHAKKEAAHHFDIAPQAPDGLRTKLNLNGLATRLNNRGIPTLLSAHAGAYLCNFVYYHSLQWCAQNGGNALFVHLPFTTQIAAQLCLKRHRAYASLPQALIEAALTHIICECAKPPLA